MVEATRGGLIVECRTSDVTVVNDRLVVVLRIASMCICHVCRFGVGGCQRQC